MGKRYISEIIEYKDEPRIRLGMMSSHRWRMDPKVVLFSMARYKFVAKMLSGKKNVIEIGCGDGWGSKIVLQEVDRIRAYDMDPVLVEESKSLAQDERITFEEMDLSENFVSPPADAAYLLDVLEHVLPEDEDAFFKNIVRSLKPDGVCVVGIPSLGSQVYASKPSQKSHVNCKNGDDFKLMLQRYFRHVFLFSMHDELIHTGFCRMAHYLLGLCVDTIPV